MEMFSRAGRKGSEYFPRKTDKTILYGTAGFRTRAEELEHIAFRMGMLAVLRSKAKGGLVLEVDCQGNSSTSDRKRLQQVKALDPKFDDIVDRWLEELYSNCSNFFTSK